jgi:hypothetical protein
MYLGACAQIILFLKITFLKEQNFVNENEESFEVF